MEFEKAKEILENEVANICDEELSEALEIIFCELRNLQEERELVGMPVKNKRDGKIGIVLHQWKDRSIAVLESINPRVINTHDSWDTLESITDIVEQKKTV